MSNNSFEGLLQRSQFPAQPGGASVGAVGGVGAVIQLIQQALDLLFGQGLVGPDGTVTGHDHAASIQCFRQAGCCANLHNFFNNFDDQRLHLTRGQEHRYGLDHESVAPEGLDLQAEL